MSENKLDITSTVLEKGIDLVKDFVEKLVGSTLEETGLLLGDNVRLFRLKNQIKMLSKAQDICKANNITLKQISLKTLVPLLEYSSLEDDESLQQMWSNLLVNYIDVNQKLESSIFPFLLSQLSTEEINVIKKLYDIFDNRNENYIISSSIDGVLKSNLIRLGIAEKLIVSENNNSLSSSYKNLLKNSIKLTDLGKTFYECCTIKK